MFFRTSTLVSLLFLSAGSVNCLPATATAPSPETTWGRYGIFDKQENVPSTWRFENPASDAQQLHLQFLIRSDASQELAERIIQISTPGHESYGKHLSHAELSVYTVPKPASVDVVVSWLQSFAGVENIEYSSSEGSVSFDTSVATGRVMFEAEFGNYQDVDGNTITRTLQYSLPEEIRAHTALVNPMTYFPRLGQKELIKEEKSAVPQITRGGLDRRANYTEVLAACREGIYPKCIAALYSIDYEPPTNASASGSKLGVAGFLEQYLNPTDISNFVSKYGNSATMRANPGPLDIEVLNGVTNDISRAGIEATLDLEYTMAFTGSIPVTYYLTGGRPPALDEYGRPLPLNESGNEPYLEWLTYMLAKTDEDLPQVITISYTDVEQEVPRAYALHVCDLFGRLAARGVSVLVASGDGGVAGISRGANCVSNDGRNATQFLPTFPASCPWVTAVGATSVIEEQAASFSSGGFSNYFTTPDYQLATTTAYMQSLQGTYDGLYNTSGRGIPDMSAYGSRYETENNNSTSGHHSGTSASSPVIAAMITLVNDIRLRKGLPVLGWLNPLIYSGQMSEVWNDITVGSTYGCDSTWNATAGWDPATGMGSVDFQRLVQTLG